MNEDIPTLMSNVDVSMSTLLAFLCVPFEILVMDVFACVMLAVSSAKVVGYRSITLGLLIAAPT